MHNIKTPPVQRHRLTAIIAVLVMTTGILLACGESASNQGTKVNESTSGTSSSSASSATQANASGAKVTSSHFKLGDQVKVGDQFMVTINSFKQNPGSDYNKPKDGHIFVVVDISIKNISNAEADISSLLQFTLKDSTGQKYDEAIVIGTTTPDGKVAAGELLRGQTAYEVPMSQHQFTFAFEADIISSGQTIWDLSI